jgi:hypothetical protein
VGSTARIEPDPTQSDRIATVSPPRVEREHRPERRAIRSLGRRHAQPLHTREVAGSKPAGFLDALETVDQDTVARLRELRERA